MEPRIFSRVIILSFLTTIYRFVPISMLDRTLVSVMTSESLVRKLTLNKTILILYISAMRKKM